MDTRTDQMEYVEASLRGREADYDVARIVDTLANIASDFAEIPAETYFAVVADCHKMSVLLDRVRAGEIWCRQIVAGEQTLSAWRLWDLAEFTSRDGSGSFCLLFDTVEELGVLTGAFFDDRGRLLPGFEVEVWDERIEDFAGPVSFAADLRFPMGIGRSLVWRSAAGGHLMAAWGATPEDLLERVGGGTWEGVAWSDCVNTARLQAVPGSVMLTRAFCVVARTVEGADSSACAWKVVARDCGVERVIVSGVVSVRDVHDLEYELMEALSVATGWRCSSDWVENIGRDILGRSVYALDPL